MFGNLIKDELQKLASQFAGLTGLKHLLYEKADALLQEGQAKSKDELDAWFAQKRMELAHWAAEATPTPTESPK